MAERRKAGKSRAEPSAAGVAAHPEAIEEIFRRFAELDPQPKTELRYRDPYTLLVAVVCRRRRPMPRSTRATPDVRDADTPEKMVDARRG